MSYIPSAIKSVTPISITIANTATSNTQTISSVVTANSILIFNGQSGNASTSAASSNAWANGVLTNATTVTANRSGSAGQVIYNATLIEFVGNFVKSSGAGTIDIADTVGSGTSTITSVNTAKLMLAYSGATSTATTSLTPTVDQFLRLVLTNATTITANRDTTTGEALVGWNYIEFK